MKQNTITLAFYLVLLTMVLGMAYLFEAQTEYIYQLPAEAREYILNEEHPQSLIIPLNELSQQEFNKLVSDLNTTTRLDKQNIIIESINK